jgi:hypothetical protein
MGMKVPYCFDGRGVPKAYIPRGVRWSPDRFLPFPPRPSATGMRPTSDPCRQSQISRLRVKTATTSPVVGQAAGAWSISGASASPVARTRARMVVANITRNGNRGDATCHAGVLPLTLAP